MDCSASHFEDTYISAIIAALENNTSVVHLNLSHCFCRDKGVEALNIFLKHNSTLKALNLQNATVATTQYDWILIFDNTHLESLNLSNMRLQSTVNLDTVLSNPNCKLKYLNLASNAMDDGMIDHLVMGLSKNESLEILDLSNNNFSAKALIKLLKQVSLKRGLTIILENKIQDDYTNEVIELIMHHDEIINTRLISSENLKASLSKNIQSLKEALSIHEQAMIAKNQLIKDRFERYLPLSLISLINEYDTALIFSTSLTHINNS